MTTLDYGRVLDVVYDAGRDRLLATIAPTPALVDRNRREGFRRVSMELAKKAGGWILNAVAFLAARRPAIDGLAAVALTAGAGTPTRRRSGLNPRIQFAESPIYDRTLRYLEGHRELSFTEALERVALVDEPLPGSSASGKAS